MDEPRVEAVEPSRPRWRALYALVALVATASLVGCSSPPEAPGAAGTTSLPGEAVAPTSTGEAVAPTPPDEVLALVGNTLTAEGRRLFYAANPQILDRAEFAAACPNGDETLVVLGCYDGRQIHILRVDRPELSRTMEVTAAHELLHAAHQALPADDRTRIDAELEDYSPSVDDPGVQGLISTYDRVGTEQRLNELHSILPTTLRSLSGGLERHYSRYFVSRDRFVDAYESSQAPFRDLKGRLEALTGEIAELAARSDQLTGAIEGRQSELEAVNGRLDELSAQDDVPSFNALVPTQNALVSDVRGLIDEFNAVVVAHNDKVEEANALALEERELTKELSSYPEGARVDG